MAALIGGRPATDVPIASIRPSEVAEIARQHELYPQSIAFGDIEEERSLDQRKRELALEHMIDECEGMLERRRLAMANSRTDIGPPPISSEIPVARNLREERENIVSDAESPPSIDRLRLVSDELREEARSAGLMKYTKKTIRPLMVDFLAFLKESLVHKKYKHMLRWARYCETDELVERTSSMYLTHIAAIDLEYGHVSSRLERLQHQAGLPDDANVAKMAGVSDSDMTLYLRHFITHHKATKKIHRLFQKVQWLPLTSRYDLLDRARDILRRARFEATMTHRSADDEEYQHSIDNHSMPLRVTSRAQLDDALLELKEYWHLSTDIHMDDGQEFFYYGNKKFQAVFCEQVAADFLPVYDVSVKLAQQHLEERAGADAVEQNGKMAELLKITADTTHLKESKWLPFVTDEPSADAAAMMQRARLLRISEVDKLLAAEAACMSVMDIEESSKRLRRLMETHKERIFGVTSIESDEAKVRILRSDLDGSRIESRDHLNEAEYQNQRDEDHSAPNYLSPAKLLSFYFLRHVRVRDFRFKLRCVLNYFRSLQRRITIDHHRFAMEADPELIIKAARTATRSTKMADGRDHPIAGRTRNTTTAKENEKTFLRNPSVTDFSEEVVEFGAIEQRDDFYEVTPSMTVRVKDAMGVYVVYDAALEDQIRLEEELLLVGTHFINKDKQRRFDSSRNGEPLRPAVDTIGVLGDLFEWEFRFQETKRQLIDCYVELYELIFDPNEMKKVAQTICNLTHLRPRIDLEGEYFAESYASDIVCLELHLRLLRMMIDTTLAEQRSDIRSTHLSTQTAESATPQAHSGTDLNEMAGFPDRIVPEHPIIPSPSSPPVFLFEFHPCMGAIASFAAVLATAFADLQEVHSLTAPRDISALHRVLLQQTMVEWHLIVKEEQLHRQLATTETASEPVALQHTTVVDNSLTVERIARELSNDLKAQDAAVARSTSSAEFRPDKGGRESGPYTTTARKLQTDPANSSLVSVLLSAVEMVRLRHFLWDTLYETEILAFAYKNQARLLGHDLIKNAPKPLNFDENADVDVDDIHDDDDAGNVQPILEPVAADLADAQMRLAISDFDAAMADFDLNSVDTIRRLLTPSYQRQLLTSYQVQVTQKILLVAAVRYNQAILDPVLNDFGLREKRLADAQLAPQPKPTEIFETQKASLKKPGRRASKDGLKFDLPTAEANRKKELSQLKRDKTTALSTVSPYFLNLNVRKSRMRSAMLAAYTEKYSSLQRTSSPEQLPARVTDLKLSLIVDYCTDILQEITPVLLRGQAVTLLTRLTSQIGPLVDENPKIFTVGRDPDARDTNEPQEKPQQPDSRGPTPMTTAREMEPVLNRGGLSILDNDEYGSNKVERTSILTSDGLHVANIWYLPHRKELLKMFADTSLSQQITCLTFICQLWHSMHDILSFSAFVCRLGPSYDYLKLENGLERLPDILKALKKEMAVFISRDQPALVAKFLAEKRVRLYTMIMIALLNTGQDFLAATNEEGFHHLSYVSRALKLGTAVPNVRALPADLRAAKFDHDIGEESGDTNPSNPESKLASSLLTTPFGGAIQPRSYEIIPYLVVAISDTDRRVVANMFHDVEQTLEDFMAEKHIYQNSEPQKALALQLTVLQEMHAAIWLRTEASRRLCGLPAIITSKQQREALIVLSKRVVEAVAERCRSTGHLSSDDERATTGAQGPGEFIPTLSSLRHIVSDTVIRGYELIVLRELVDLNVLALQSDKVRSIHDALTSDFRSRNRLTMAPKDGEGVDGDTHAPTADTEKEFRAKIEFLQSFVSELMATSANGPINVQGEKSRIITEPDLDALIGNLTANLIKWNEDRMVRVTKSAATDFDFVSHQLYVAEREKKHLANLRASDHRELKQKVQTNVADKGYELILELSELYRQLAKVKENMEGQHILIHQQVQQEYEDKLAEAQKRIDALEGNFKDFRRFLRDEMQSELYKIKQDTSRKFTELLQLPVDVKKRAQHLADLEGQVQSFREDNSKLEKTILKLKTMSKMKDIASQYAHQKSLREERQDKYTKTRKLFDMRERMEQGEAMLKQLLASTQRALARAEQEVEALRKDLELQQRNKQALVQWKVAKSHVLEDLEGKLAKFERWRHIDVGRLLLELEKKDAELRALNSQRDVQSRQVDLTTKKRERQMQKLAKQLEFERQVKQEAFDKIEGLRTTAPSPIPDPTTTTLATEDRSASNGALWKRKHDAVFSDMQLLVRENDILRETLANLGIEAPSPVPSSMSSPAPSTRPSPMPTARPTSASRAPQPTKRSVSSLSSSRRETDRN